MSLGLLATPTVTICKVAKMVFNVAPGNFYLSQYLEYQEANGTSATVEALANLAGGTDAAFVTSVLTNLGLADVTEASTFLTTNVAANGRGAALEAAIEALNGIAANNATYGAAKTAFDSAVTTSVVYSTNTANNSTDTATLAEAISEEATSGGGVSNLSLVFTSNTDNLAGQSGDDTFTGTVHVTTPANGTVSVGDVINGGAGTDTMVLKVANGNPSSATVPTLTNIETLQIDALVATSVTMTGISPSDNVVVNAPASTVAFTAAPVALDEYTIKDIKQNGADITVTNVAGLTSGSANTLTLNVADSTAASPSTAGNSSLVTFTGAAASDGWDVVNVVATGTNRLQGLVVTDSAAASTMDSLTVTGSGSLRIETALDFSGTTGTWDSSGSTGAMNVGFGTEDITATFGAGDDRATVGTAADLTSADTINMGAGDDTFGWAETATTSALNTTLTAAVSNFETLEFTAAITAVDFDWLGGVSNILVSGASAGGVTYSDIQDDDQIEISGNPAGISTFTAKLDDGTNVLNLTLNSATSGGNIVATNFETVNLAIAGSAASTNTGNTFTVGTNGVINVTGDQDMNLGTLVGTNASVLAAEFTGDLTVTGEAGNNTLTGGTGDDTLSGAGGRDTISGTAGTNVINGGTGLDILAGGSGRDTFAYIADDDTTVANADGETIASFTLGTDRLSFDTTGIADGAGTNDAAVAGDVANQFADGMATGTLKSSISAAADNDAALALALAAASVADNDVFGFVYDGDTYIVHADAANAAGNVVELTGVTATQISEVTSLDIFLVS